MKCRTIEEDLSALLDGELSAVEERRIRDHLALCARCRAALDELRRTSRLLRAWDRAHRTEPSESFTGRVVRGARRGGGSRETGRRAWARVFFPRAAAAAGLLLLAGAAVGVLLSAGPGPAPGVRPAPGLRGEYARRAAELDPDDAAGHLALAEWCREAGLPERAAREELLAFAADPEDPAVRRAIAELLPRESAAPAPLSFRVAPLPDLGGPLPPPAVPRASPGGRYRRLGLARAGDRWFTPEAYRAFRERREEEELLAREAERKRELVARRRVEVAPDTSREPVVAWLSTLRPSSAAAARGLTVVPLLGEGPGPGLSVLGLAEALERNVIVIREDTGSARLVAENRDPGRHVFLAAGEILRGGYQDRILTRDTLIPPKTTAGLPVLCCERVRMLGPTRRFQATPGLAPSGIRAFLVVAGSQDGVWKRISRDLAALGAGNPTEALAEIYRTGRGARNLASTLRDLEGGLGDARTVGFLVFAGDRLLGGDVFAGHDLLLRLGPRFLGSFVLEALRGKHRGKPEVDPRALLATVKNASFLHRRGAVMGRETEFGGGGSRLSGTALVPAAGLPPLHVSLFPDRGEAETRALGGEGVPPDRAGRSPPPSRDRSRAGRRLDERRRRRLSGKLPDPGGWKPPERPRPPSGGARPGPGRRPPPVKTPVPEAPGR